jgi:carotenoid cleavage dioxygenase-like enzyme
MMQKDAIGDLDLRLAHGTWPADLSGEIFISTSEQATAGRHAFFGDGVMIRMSLQPGSHGAGADGWALRSAVLDTPSRRLRERTPEVFESGAYGTSSPYGMVNAANTAPLPWGDRLFATWDAGRPVEVDPLTLRCLGEVGHRDGWPVFMDTPLLPFIPSSAHPVIDSERGCMWTVAYNPMDQRCWVLRWSGEGRTVLSWPVADAPIPQSMHTISQTRDWLILVDCAFRADPDEIFGTGERTSTTDADEPVYLIRKDAFDAAAPGDAVPSTSFRLAPETNHFYAAYDDADGIRVLFEHTVNTDLAMALRDGDTDAQGHPCDPALTGLYMHPASPAVLSVMELDPASGKITGRAHLEEPDRYWATQLSAMDWSGEGQERPTRHHMLFGGYRPEAIAERYLDLYAGRVDPSVLPGEETPSVLATLDRDTLKPATDFVFPLDEYPTSPCFVPRDPGAAATSRYAGSDPGGHDGYVVVPVLRDGGTRVEVFDAAEVGAGPVAGLATPAGETLPFLIHSSWMPRAAGADHSIERLSFADEVDVARLAQLPADLAAAAQAVALELSSES